MIDTQREVAINAKPGGSANPLCFLLDDDFAFRQGIAKELRRDDIDVVEFSTSARFVDMIDDQNPDIVFVNLNSAAPHECVRALLALKECDYPGAVQLFGRCEPKTLESFFTIGADCSLTMLPPIQKPIKAATIHKIISDRRLGTPAPSSERVSLSDALAKNYVTFLYQPKFDLKANVIVGVEAMARVSHPKLGLLTPEQFLKGADDDALLKLSRLALLSALKASTQFHQAAVSLQVAINISADNLLRLPVADLALLHRPESGDWPGLLLEVTERQVVNNIEGLKARLPRLQQAGVSMAIDNFALRTSCLSALKQIPFAEIKIDRSLVQSSASNTGDANICKTLIQLAHNFGSRAVAVGISTKAELQTFSGFDCDMGQGFLFSKPTTMQQISASIANFKSRAL